MIRGMSKFKGWELVLLALGAVAATSSCDRSPSGATDDPERARALSHNSFRRSTPEPALSEPAPRAARAVELITTAQGAPGDDATAERVFVERCGACHTLEPPPRNAPPLRGIIRNYRSKFPEHADFIAAITAFTANPTEKTAIMSHAVQRFGLMPKLPFAADELQLLAEWFWRRSASVGGSGPCGGCGAGQSACGDSGQPPSNESRQRRP